MKSSAIVVTIFAIVMLTGCATDSGFRVEPEQHPPLPPSMKGYELYSWYVEPEGAWYYTLVTATNRLKTYEEITSVEDKTDKMGWVKITVKGVDSLKELLGRLPEGEVVVWVDGSWLEEHLPGEGQDFAFPEQHVVDAIEQQCQHLGLELHLASQDG